MNCIDRDPPDCDDPLIGGGTPQTTRGDGWGRRDVLRSLVAAAGVAPFGPIGRRTRPRVGIVGAGMAGVSLAWLLDGQFDVSLIESRQTIGGNVMGVDVELDGHAFVVDIGAQYFHPGPYPAYTALLTHLGLYPPAPEQAASAHAFPATITVTAEGEPTPRFVSPAIPGRFWPLLAPWNLEGVAAFAVGFGAAQDREQRRARWGLTLGEWLPTLGLNQRQWEGMLLPWAASIFSGDIDQARSLSARAAMIFAAKALPPNPLDPLLYYVLSPGMGVALDRLIEQCSTVQVLTGTAVSQVSRAAFGTFTIRLADGRALEVDELVFAASGPGTLALLNALPGTGPQRAALHGIEFFEARLALHTDPIYAPANPNLRSFFNCEVTGGFSEASMWLGPVLTAPPPATAARLWKSWVTHRDRQPEHVLHEATFRHMLPTPATLLAQSALRAMQGRGGVWFAGGYTFAYDAQETALLSALQVALGLQAESARSRIIEDAATTSA